LALRTESRISNYYWVNVLDRDMPFVALFEHANLAPSLESGLAYTVAYTDEGSHLWRMGDESLLEFARDCIGKVFGRAPRVKSWSLFRAPYGTPVYSVGYETLPINPAPRLYLAGIYRAFPEIRSSGPAIRTGIEAAEGLLRDLG